MFNVLDGFGRCPSWTNPYQARFNPMGILLKDKARMIELAALIADALIIHSNHGDPHWNESAQTVLEGIILNVATHPAYEGKRNLISVRRAVLGGAEMERNGETIGGLAGLLYQMEKNKALDGFIAAIASSIVDKSEKERSGIMSTAQRHTKFLDLPPMKNVLEGDDFALSDLKTSKNGVTVFLVLPTGKMGTCNRWLRMMINLALQAMEDTIIPNSSLSQTGTALPVMFLLDEFATLEKMSQIEIAAAQIAGFGAVLHVILQDLSQLEALYEKRWQTFLGNAGTIQLFSMNDLPTLKFASERLGKTSVIVQNKSQQSHTAKMSGATGESYQIQTEDLLSIEEAARYFSRDDPKRRQLIIRPGQDAMIIQRIKYFDPSLPEHKYFKGKYREWS